jgi:integrase
MKSIKTQANLLTENQLADILQISEYALGILVNSGKIPHVRSGNTPSVRFNPEHITGWLRQSPALLMNKKNYIIQLKNTYQKQFPEALNELKKFASQFPEPKPKKGYNLTKVKNKKHGFLYYVRYIEKGKLIPSRWNTHTSNIEEAEKFARENRERILAAYHRRKQPEHDLYAVLKEYYQNNSPYLEKEKLRGHTFGKKSLSVYRNFILKTVIPFFEEQGVKNFENIDAPLIVKLQDHLLGKQNKPQTVNSYIGCLRAIFDHLFMRGIIAENIFSKIISIKAYEDDYTVRGCHEINSVRGVFDKKWEDQVSYLLCLAIYTTGMRNSEIERVKACDIIKIEECRFINVRDSKTRNGIRLVPLHDFVYHKITAYIAAAGKQDDDFLFLFPARGKVKHNQTTTYKKANSDMASVMGISGDELIKQHITYYSGRHFWKTLMNSEGLGDVEEYFMGHKVSNDVAKRYNHKDKQGREKLLEKAKEVFAILDKKLL